jgi:hypothetical protein
MITLADYGDIGKFLVTKGWKISPTIEARGTAYCDASKKTIFVKSKVFNVPNVRVRQYVIRHETWHALHAELMGYDCDSLMSVNGLSKRSAIEVVAEMGCLYHENSTRMRYWVKTSTVWHGKVGYKYSFNDIRSEQSIMVVQNLMKMLKAELSKQKLAPGNPTVADGRL